MTDIEIDAVQEFIKTKLLQRLKKILASSLDDGIDADNVLIDHEQLVEHFGLYASNPDEFEFQLGDRMLIKQLVCGAQQIIDSKETNLGPNFFQVKERKRQKETAPSSSKKKKDPTDSLGETKIIQIDPVQFDVIKLKSDLTEKIIACLKSYGADQLINTELEKVVDDECINVTFEEAGVYGSINCVICTEKKVKKTKPKRVFYNLDSNHWVVSNFAKHLKSHGLNLQESNVKKESSTEQTDDTQKNEPTTQSPAKNIINNSIMISKKEEADFGCRNTNSDLVDNKLETKIYSQISDQITMMMATSMQNSESQSDIEFELKENDCRSIVVAKTPGDGNCLFSTLAHQLFQNKIRSKSHKVVASNLRADVVNHILDDTKYPDFEYRLKERVYEKKNAKDVVDITLECKSFVNNELSQDKTWGGSETIKAVSDIYKVNIVEFKEDGPCILNKFNENYNRSIAIAHRLSARTTKSGKQNRNHYDSVCDITSENMFAIAQRLAFIQTNGFAQGESVDLTTK